MSAVAPCSTVPFVWPAHVVCSEPLTRPQGNVSTPEVVVTNRAGVPPTAVPCGPKALRLKVIGPLAAVAVNEPCTDPLAWHTAPAWVAHGMPAWPVRGGAFWPGLTTVDGKVTAFIRLFTLASRVPSGGRFQRVSMNFKIEVVSYWVWSMKPRLANGEMISVGTRRPGPHSSITGGGTWSQNPPCSSY